MKTKNRTFKIILLLTLSILMLAIMAVFPLVDNASAISNEGENLFDMNKFNEDSLTILTDNVFIRLVDAECLIFSYDSSLESFNITSGNFLLQAGTYTLSAFVEKSYDEYVTICLVPLDGSISLGNIYFTTAESKTETFTLDMSTSFRLQIYAGSYGVFEGRRTVALNNIMLNAGDTALPFVPFDYVEPDSTNTDIIAKLDELFGAESGIIAGASLGTVILLIAILLFITKRR